VLSKETLEESQESQRGDKRTFPRLVRVLRFDRLESGGGPVVELVETSVSIGRGDAERVGRDGTCVALDIDDPVMSRLHARIVPTADGQHVLEDLGSTNGTWLDGRAIQRETLEDGQIIETGRNAWLFRLAPPGAPSHVELGPTRSFSPAIFALASQLQRLAPSAVSLLLMGETGTGKEVLARELHAKSGRPGRFVAVNCGALTESLLESELFGHRRGAFTGASADRPGHVESADGGTLFLDEIGEMPPSAQVRLLRVLEAGEVVAVGATTPRRVDVRIVAATHRDLLRMVDEGRFREDLYARLEGWVLTLPRLVDRREDLGELVAHVVRTAGVTHAQATPRAARAILTFDWPFNVRQLIKAIEAALTLANDGTIELDHLPMRVRESARAPATTGAPGMSPASVAKPLDPEDRELCERLVNTLRAHGGNVTRAAQALGKQRQQMQRWMRRFGLRAEDYGGSDE
jgi:DNA-binding NtrC family response regulator